jgi:hypothetical protein
MAEAPEPCSIEALKAWRAEHPEGSESMYAFHTHNYFNPDDPAEVEIGKAFYAKMREAFTGVESALGHTLGGDWEKGLIVQERFVRGRRGA